MAKKKKTDQIRNLLTKQKAWGNENGDNTNHNRY